MSSGPGDTLSQEEIDALLASLPAGGEGEAPVAAKPEPQLSYRAYDFRRPDKFSKEQIRALRMMHEDMGRRMALALSAYLRTTVETTLADIDQGTYATFLSQTTGLAVYNLVSMKPLHGQMILEISGALADVMIDRLLGGPGRVWEQRREFTDLELSLLQGAVSHILESLAEAWAAVLPVTPHVEETLLNLYFVQLGLLSDAMVWIVFEVRVGEANGHLRLGLPYSLLKPVSDKLSPQAWIAGAEAAAESAQSEDIANLIHHLQEVPVDVVAVLGEVETTFEEINALKPGDLIPLDAPANRDIKVLVEGVHRFWARPGTRGTRLAVEITRVVSQEDAPRAALAEPGAQHGRVKALDKYLKEMEGGV